ncbi:MAG: hypothetical protein J7K36_08925 [Archaeoglobaceae archaeon]|nr:hypothetical protein [Archaeoglobaceae archaeon]
MREKEFLDFNIDNIFTNLYQAEDHLRRLENTNNKEGHASCVFKHLSFVSGELGEAISHSSVVRPELTPIFQKLMKETDSLRYNLDSLSVDEAIRKVREIRKVIEKINPKYNTEKCQACGIVAKEIEEKIFNKKNPGDKKDKFFNKNNSINNMDKKDISTIVASQFAGKGIQEFAEFIDIKLGRDKAELIGRPSTWINILGGLGGVLAGLYLLEDNPNLQLASVVVGSNLLTKIVDYGKEYAAMKEIRSLSTEKPVKSEKKEKKVSLITLD